VIFAFSFTKPKTSRDWRSFGAFSAFIVALFTEMYGFPLTIYLLSGWLTRTYPGIDPFSHDAGHLWSTLLGLHGDPHWSVLHIVSIAAIFGGLILLSAAWKALYDAQSRHALATTGVYEHVRHPQYLGFIVIMLGFLLQWPTILTLLMFPLLVVMYVRLARMEEREALREFGDPLICNGFRLSCRGLARGTPHARHKLFASGTFEVAQDRAFRPMIAVACGCQFLDCITHGHERRDLGVDLADMIKSKALDVGAGAPFVMPEIKQPPDALDREAEIAGAANEAECADIGFAVNTIATFAAAGGRDQAGGLVIADRFGRHAGSLGCLSDIHSDASSEARKRLTPHLASQMEVPLTGRSRLGSSLRARRRSGHGVIS
jgi:protein-S-isoprenylcysteine O-methyltransferase Ste14